MKNISILLLVPLLITGCTSTYNMEVLKAPPGKLQRGHAVLVHTPANGHYGSKTYARSGQMTAGELKQGFAPYASEVKLVPAGKSRNDFSGFAGIYYVQPEIQEWEERATEWSGKPDRIKVKVDIYETSSMNHVSSVIFSGKSKWMTLGGDHPEELLPKPIEDYIITLY